MFGLFSIDFINVKLSFLEYDVCKQYILTAIDERWLSGISVVEQRKRETKKPNRDSSAVNYRYAWATIEAKHFKTCQKFDAIQRLEIVISFQSEIRLATNWLKKIS